MIFENIRKWLLSDKNCYVAKVECSNCNYEMLIKIPKGKKVSEVIGKKKIYCKKCGLDELNEDFEGYY